MTDEQKAKTKAQVAALQVIVAEGRVRAESKAEARAAEAWVEARAAEARAAAAWAVRAAFAADARAALEAAINAEGDK